MEVCQIKGSLQKLSDGQARQVMPYSVSAQKQLIEQTQREM